MAATGLDFKTQSESVRTSVDLDGSLSGIQVVRSSGSPQTDGAVTLNAGAGPAR